MQTATKRERILGPHALLTIRIAKKDLTSLKRFAKLKGTTVSQIIRKFVRSLISRKQTSS